MLLWLEAELLQVWLRSPSRGCGLPPPVGPVHPTHPISRTMADLWMLFPTEEEYIQVGRGASRPGLPPTSSGCCRARHLQLGSATAAAHPSNV